METSQLFYKYLTLIKRFSLILTEKAVKITSQLKLFGTPKPN